MKKYIAFSVMVLLLACSPKVVEVVEQEPEEVTSPVVKERTTPCQTFSDLPASKRDGVENAFVFYKDFMSMKRYDSALKPWRMVFDNAPGSNGVVKSHFQDGVTLYSQLVTNAESDAQKQKYIDTIRMINDKRVECFGGDADFFGKVAFDYYYQLKEYVPEDEIFGLFKKSADMSEKGLPYYVVNPFTKMLYDKVQAGTIDLAEGRKYAKMIDNTITKGLEDCKGEQCDTWEIIADYAPARLSALEGVEGFYDCEYYLSKYYSLFKDNNTDCEVINTVYSRLLRGGCDPAMAEVAEVKSAKDTECYVPPPPPGKLKQAYDAYQSGDYKKAVDLFAEVADEQTDPEKKAKYYFLSSKIYYADIKNFPQSRKYALKAAEQKSGWGEPYILIGKLYASSGPLCGPGRGWDSQIVTWPAIDKFEYAKKVDPSVASEANALIRQYRQYMPKKEDIFFRQIKAGDSFTVPCWIQERTRVRTAD